MSDKTQRQIPLDYGTHGLTEEEQDLYKYCFEEDGYAYQFEEDKEKEQVEGEGYNHGYSEDDEDEEEEEEENEFSPFHDLYSDDDRLDDEYDYDDDYGYEDKLFGNSGKSHHFSGKTPSSSEKMKKAGKSNKSSGGSSGLNTSIPLRRQLSSKSEDNLANHSQKYKVLEMLEASKQTNYWSVFDSSYQGVLEYGVVIKLIGWNQYLIYCAGQNVIGITLKGFLNHYRKIEEGDVVVYQVIDSSLTFTVSKVYISANSELEEIEILYRRGELSPPLYQLHKKIKEESMKVLSSQKGNSLQEFLYHCQERTVLPFRSSNHQNPAVLEEKKDQLSVSQITWEGSLTKELKELYHFNQMILEKIIDYFHDYLQKQPQMKYMILKMTNNTIRTSSSMNSLSNTSTVNSLLPTLTITTSDSVRGEDDTVVDDDVTKDRNNNNSKSSKKLEKSKSKVGILLYLFFLESIHHLLYQLPAVVNHRLPSHHTFNTNRIRSGNPSQQRLNNLNNRTEKLRIQEIYHYSILSYNMNNCFGKLIRCLFQQILFYLCESNIFYSPLSAYPSPVKTKPCSLSLNTVPVSFEDLDDRPKGPIRSHSQEVYHRIIERICHMDVIINILPFLSFEDIYQCLFLLFPKSVTDHLYQHTIRGHHSNHSFDLSSSQNTNSSSLQMMLNHNNNASSNSASGSGSSSIFGNLENLKIIIQHFFHEINQNTYYIGIANDIYDLFSYNIDWEKFIQRVS